MESDTPVGANGVGNEGEWWKTMLPPEMRRKPSVLPKEKKSFDKSDARNLILSYEKRHRQAFDELEKRQGGDNLKFVVVSPGSGFGNRQMVIVAAFLYALLSQRVLLVDWLSHETQALGDVHDLYESPSGLKLSYSQARRLWPEWGGWGNASMLVFDNTHYYTTEWSVEELACRNFTEEHSEDSLVYLITDQYVASFMSINPFYETIVAQLGDGGSLFKNLFSILLRPVKPIRKIVEDFVDKNFYGYYVIGMQVRYGVGQFYLKEDQDEFWRCALSMGRQLPISTQKKLRYFIASDSQQIIHEAKRALGNKLIYYETVRGNDAAGQDAWYGAAVDNFLLSECDDIIVTSTSTFGYVAAARKDIAPMTMSGMFRRCVRPLSSQPQNTAHAAIRRTTCFENAETLRPEEDMLCANLGSNHACNSPTALKMAEQFQNRPLAWEINFNMHHNGEPAMPSDVVKKLDEISRAGGIDAWSYSFEDHMREGIQMMRITDISMAREQFRCASAIAYIDGSPHLRIEAYKALARAYLSEDSQSDLDLSGAMHMFWRILKHSKDAAISLNLAQLLQAYNGVPKVNIIATLFRQSLHLLSEEEEIKIDMAALGYFKLEKLLEISRRDIDTKAISQEFPKIKAALEDAGYTKDSFDIEGTRIFL
mmetsp:Transcript_13744/g.20753  ORF Transcript_13744/g.20753 Transcript_13744/m.20753 type:complete len:652 (-) Transcript_13744:128-2083(-)